MLLHCKHLRKLYKYISPAGLCFRFVLSIITIINMLPITIVSIIYLLQLDGATPSLVNIAFMCLSLLFISVKL